MAKEYEAIFSLGAKLQSSFGAAFGAAQRQISTVGKFAANLGKTFLKVASVVGVLGGAIAALAIGNVFRKIFAGAGEAAKQALERTQQLTAALRANPKLQALGNEVIEGQVLALQKVSAELGKQGVVHSDHFEQASRTLALYGMGPKTIASWLPALGDTLVATKGINATVGDMQSLTEAVTKAINPGQVKGLQEAGVVMSKNDKKAWDALKPAERQIRLQEILTKKYQDANKAAADTPLGKIKQWENMMAGMSETLGLKMIPYQAKMAEFWMQIFPSIMPTAEKLVDAFGKTLVGLTDFAIKHLVPAFKTFGDFLTSPDFAGSLTMLGEVFGDLAKTVGPAVTGIFSSLGIEGKTFGEIMTGVVKEGITTVINLIIRINRTIAILKEAWAAVSQAATNAWNGIQAVWSGELSLGDLLAPIQTAWGGLVSWFDSTVFQPIIQAHQQFFGLLEKPFTEAIAPIQAAWNGLLAFFGGVAGKIASGLAGVSKALLEAFMAPIKAIQDAWNTLVNAISNFKLPDLGSAIQSRQEWIKSQRAAQQAPKTQYGGIFRTPQIRQVAEAGVPEAVIPLQRSERSRGLLGAAASAIGGGAGTAMNRTSLNFNPVVSIAGNATPETVRELDRSLRSLADDFLARYNRATDQERRLAFS